MADGSAPNGISKRRRRFDGQGRKIRTVNSPGHFGTHKAGPRGERPSWAPGVIARSQHVDAKDREARRLGYGSEGFCGDYAALNAWSGLAL
jgi:hypothetical protein